jgi:hypothetical protein
MTAGSRCTPSRNSYGRLLVGLGGILAGLTAASPTFGCAACGCSLSTDGAMGFANPTGFRLTLQWDYLDQDQLRFGRSSVSTAQVAALNTPAPGLGQEVEHQTINRYTTLGLIYAPSSDWSFSALVPYIDRSHSTYGGASNPVTPDQLSSATVTGLGDVKFLASYTGLLSGNNLAVHFGLKLPTGNYGGQNMNGGPVAGRNPVSFGPSGNSGGMLLDTSLQAGTGSTDLLLGVLYHQAISENVRAFGNAQFQAAIATRLDQAGSDFRPGNQGSLTLGLRFEAGMDVVPQVQLNLVHKSADQGALADTADTAGTVAYLSPGIIGKIGPGLQAYAFIQLPLYSNLSGFQLFPHWTGTVGLAYRF